MNRLLASCYPQPISPKISFKKLSFKDLGTEIHKELSKTFATDVANINSHTKALTGIDMPKM